MYCSCIFKGAYIVLINKLQNLIDNIFYYIYIFYYSQEFAPPGDWIHMDIAGVMKSAHENNSYVSGAMTGKPTRALVQFVSNLCK